MTTVFSIAFWKTAAENALVAGVTAFSGAFTIQGAATLKGLEAAAIAGGLGALYSFTKQLGATQAVQGVLKVEAPK